MISTVDEIMIKFAEDMMSGESEWPRPAETEIVDVKPEETIQPEFTDPELLSMIMQDPMHVATNLMIQRRPEYQRIEIIHPLLRGVVDYMTNAKLELEPGSLVYDEVNFMIDFFEKEIEKKDKQEA